MHSDLSVTNLQFKYFISTDGRECRNQYGISPRFLRCSIRLDSALIVNPGLTIPAADSVNLSDDRSAIVLTAVPGFQLNVIASDIVAFEGQLLYVPNQDVDDATFEGHSLPAGQAAAFMYLAANFWSAVETCVNAGYHLCSWNEWYGACANGVGTNMTNGWEWIDDVTATNTIASIIGQNTCFSGNSATFANIYSFRCCCPYIWMRFLIFPVFVHIHVVAFCSTIWNFGHYLVRAHVNKTICS